MQGSNVEDSAAVLANATKDELEKYVQKLMKHITMLRGGINVIENDGLYKRGYYNHWTRVGVHMWEDDMQGFMDEIFNWTMNHGIRVTDGRPDKVLSKEQKRQLILSMDGWVVQESFDSIVSRLPRSPRILLLQYFMQILILKDIWRRFWRNPFWYLEPALAPGSADPDSKNAPGFDAVAPFGEDVSRLYQEFQRGELPLKIHGLSRPQVNRTSCRSGFGAGTSLAGPDCTSCQHRYQLQWPQWRLPRQEPGYSGSQSGGIRPGQICRSLLPVLAPRIRIGV